MQTHTEKTNSNEPANDSHEKREQGLAASFGENAQAAQLKAAQKMADNSPQAHQLAQLKHMAATGQPITQLKTDITHTTGTVPAMGGKYTVGKSMDAWLDPKDPIQGSATGVNSPWMQWIRGNHKDANVVRGHLLNHDLGGFGIEENLYPISTLANAQHSANVEQKVKGNLTALNGKVTHPDEGYVHYTVDVNEHDSYKKAQFICTWDIQHPRGKVVEGPFTKRIDSDLGKDKGGFGFGGKKNNQSPAPWRHGTSKGGTEVADVRARVEDAMGKNRMRFVDETTKTAAPPTDYGGKQLDSDQDPLEAWFDNVWDPTEFDHAWDIPDFILEDPGMPSWVLEDDRDEVGFGGTAAASSSQGMHDGFPPFGASNEPYSPVLPLTLQDDETPDLLQGSSHVPHPSGFPPFGASNEPHSPVLPLTLEDDDTPDLAQGPPHIPYPPGFPSYWNEEDNPYY